MAIPQRHAFERARKAAVARSLEEQRAAEAQGDDDMTTCWVDADERRYLRDIEIDEAISERRTEIGAEIVRTPGALAEYLEDKGWALGDLMLPACSRDNGGDAETLLYAVLSVAGEWKPEPAYVCARLESLAARIADVIAEQDDIGERAKRQVLYGE